MRSREEILAEMDAVQAADPALAGLSDVNSSTSNVSYFKLLKDFFVQLWQLIENKFDQFQLSINNQIEENRAGSMDWLISQVLAFQFGDAITVIKGRVSYDVIDPAKQIIKQVAGIEDPTTGRILIKAVKAAGVPLVSNELEALKNYVSKVKFVGMQIDVASLPADQLKVLATVKVDRKVLASDGSLLTNPAVFPVYDALASYCQNLPHNSVLSNTLLTDDMQKVPGVLDFTVTSSFTRRPDASIWNAYSRETLVVAGHLVVHNDSSLTYVN